MNLPADMHAASPVSVKGKAGGMQQACIILHAELQVGCRAGVRV